MRLTKAVSGRGGKYIFDLLDAQIVADKLGLLEDIEEGLGNNLIKLFKALEPNQHIWSIGNFEGVKCYVGDKYLTEYKEIIAYSGNKDNFVICHLCDYGKTWAFTKEELKNETTRNDTKRTR